MKRYTYLIILVLISISHTILGKDQVEQDSSSVVYPYLFPIWGDAATERGYKLQLPHGIMSNNFYNVQDLLISDLQLSLDDNALMPIDFVEFGKVNAKVITTNVRVDTWVLPFINVYGFGGYLSAQMEVNLTKPVPITTNTTNRGTYYGFGLMAAGKAGPLFITGDVNFAWTNLELLKKPTLARIMGLRVGHRFNVRNKPQQNIAVWIGLMNQHLGSNTVGSITVSNALDLSEDEIKEIEDWYDGLPEGPAKEIVGGILEDIANPSDTKINYSIKKDLKSKWNGLVGAQWQINEHWQLRSEFGFGSKQQTLVSLNYRFGIRGKNFKSK